MMMLGEIDYSVFPPINATLNSISAVLLLTGFFLIKAGKRRAHQKAMVGALASSAVFLACYLTYHYGVGHTVFPKEYPVARTVYLTILIPHIILAVINVPLILLLVIAAFRKKFEKHKKLARITFPSWLFVSVTGVVIYFMVYVWFVPSEKSKPPATEGKAERVGPATESGGLVFFPATQELQAQPGDESVEVYFTVKNPTDQEISVASIRSGCTCLAVSIDIDPIPAGGEATITGEFDISELRGTSVKSISVKPDRRSRPVVLSTTIQIDEIYTLVESLTTWRVGDDPETKTVEFRVLREEPIRILNVESQRAEVVCKLVVLEDGRAYDLKLTPDSTEGSLLGIVRIETDCELENYSRPLAYYAIQR